MLKNLFRKRTLEELKREADARFDAGELGEAKLAYDRLAERASSAAQGVREAAEARASECCDRLAERRAEEARKLFAAGERTLALEEARHALDTVRSADVRARIQAIAARFEQQTEATSAADAPREVAPLSDEERVMLLTGSWEPAQAEEFERHGEPLLEALLALDRGDGDTAKAVLEQLIATADAPRYLWLELGRAHLAREARDEAEQALRTFVTCLDDDVGGTPRLLAHRELARIAHERGDRDAAVAELEASAEALSDDPRPYLDLGNYLRLIGRAREALEVLAMCEGLFPEGQVEWPVTLEIGLAAAATGDDARGTALLEAVVQQLLAKGERDLPPIAAETLAGLHERAGNPARAADLYRILTTGSDVPNHARYHAETVRLLELAGLAEEAERVRARATAPEPLG